MISSLAAETASQEAGDVVVFARDELAGHSVVMMSLLGSIKSEHWVVNRLYWNEVSPSPFLLDPVIKQLAIKLVGEYGFVIRPSLVGLTS
ncbi:hypothetical protein Tco_1143271 [Tanacetum coccineum]